MRLPPSGDDYGDIVRLLFYILASEGLRSARLQWDEVGLRPPPRSACLPVAARTTALTSFPSPLLPLAILGVRWTTRAPDAVAVFGPQWVRPASQAGSFAKAELDQPHNTEKT